MNNLKFGIGVLGFYGTVVIKNTQCNENETEGLVFARSANDPTLLGRRDTLDDDAQFLDYADPDYTERSSRPLGMPNRSHTVHHPTEQAICVDECDFSPVGGAEPHLKAYERPFEKQVGNVFLLKCYI